MNKKTSGFMAVILAVIALFSAAMIGTGENSSVLWAAVNVISGLSYAAVLGINTELPEVHAVAAK